MVRPTREMRPQALRGPIVSRGMGTTWGGTATGFETDDEGGNPESFPHGDMGATETVDAADGNHHNGTLDQDCTVTVAAFADGTITFSVYQDGTGGWGITWSGVDFGDGDDQPDQTADSATDYTFIADDGNVRGYKAGGGGSSVGALDDLSDVTIIAPAEDDDLRYNGSVWVNDARKWEAVTNGEDVFVWEGDDLVHEWSS